MRAHTLALLLLPTLALGLGVGRHGASRQKLAANDVPPVTRVVKLLEEMKAQVETEAKEDEEIYDKMACWCETNDKEKTAAIKFATEKIEELEQAIEEGTARSGKLKTEIAGLKDDIAAAQESLDKATAIREEEKGEFEATDKDLSESITLLKQAVETLAKVQLAQTQGHSMPVQQQIGEAMVQVRSLVSRATKAAARTSDTGSDISKLRKKESGIYKSVMQKDLWDLLGDMPSAAGEHVVTGLAQQPTGAAAGAKSYNARSGGILGILQTMMENMEADLAAAQKAEIQAELSFQRLRSAKEGEMQAAGQALEDKTAELASTDQKVAENKADLEDTKAALSADEKFLMDLKDRCATADKEYAERSKTRQDEITAIAETIKILMEDDARDLASKTFSFMQASRGALSEAAKQQQQRAVSQLLAVARRHRNTASGWKLAMLAVNVQLDGFTKVKEMMDKMVAELKKQQKDENEKHDQCKANIKSNEDDTMVKESEKKDLQALIAGLEGTMASLTQELDDLKTKTVETHVALKTASEERKAENKEFQQVVSDQRSMIAILEKALQRLQKFYGASLLAVKTQGRQEPGAAVAPPPPAGKEYSENSGSAGVMQMLEKIIQDAQTADQEAVAAEQESQQAYGAFVANTNQVLDATADSINEKEIAKGKAEADLLTAKKDLATTETTLADLADQSKAYHLDCDYLLKNFNLRQQARQEEIEAVAEAKAILSGADFGL